MSHGIHNVGASSKSRHLLLGELLLASDRLRNPSGYFNRRNKTTCASHPESHLPMDDAPAEKQQQQKQSDHNRKPEETMSKLAPSLKALINAPFARPGPSAAPSHIRDVYQAIARDAAQKNVGAKPWLAISVGNSVAIRSPIEPIELWIKHLGQR